MSEGESKARLYTNKNEAAVAAFFVAGVVKPCRHLCNLAVTGLSCRGYYSVIFPCHVTSRTGKKRVVARTYHVTGN